MPTIASSPSSALSRPWQQRQQLLEMRRACPASVHTVRKTGIHPMYQLNRQLIRLLWKGNMLALTIARHGMVQTSLQLPRKLSPTTGLPQQSLQTSCQDPCVNANPCKLPNSLSVFANGPMNEANCKYKSSRLHQLLVHTAGMFANFRSYIVLQQMQV